MRILNESLNVLIINKSEISIHQAMNERSTTLLARLPVAMHTQMRFLHMKRKTNSPKTHFRKHLEHRHLQTPNQILRARRERRKVGTQRAEVASALPLSFAITLPRNSSSAAGHLGFIRLDGSAASVARS